MVFNAQSAMFKKQVLPIQKQICVDILKMNINVRIAMKLLIRHALKSISKIAKSIRNSQKVHLLALNAWFVVKVIIQKEKT